MNSRHISGLESTIHTTDTNDIGDCTVLILGDPCIKVGIKTHDSESRGQEEAGRTRRMSVLFTGSTGVKIVNALNKPPLKLSLS